MHHVAYWMNLVRLCLSLALVFRGSKYKSLGIGITGGASVTPSAISTDFEGQEPTIRRTLWSHIVKEVKYNSSLVLTLDYLLSPALYTPGVVWVPQLPS